MSLSSFCLILGIFFYVFGFPLVFSEQRYSVWRRKIMKDENLVRIIGMAFAMVSVTTLRWHWQIDPSMEGFVVAVAWLLFLKSLCMAWWPANYEQYHRALERKFLSREASQVVVGFIMVLLGALFTYTGILLPS